MPHVNQITGYKTSKDYKRLVELMKVQSVICLHKEIQDCGFKPVKRIGNTIYDTFGASGELFRISTDADCFSESDFIYRCEKINVEFLEPDK